MRRIHALALLALVVFAMPQTSFARYTTGAEGGSECKCTCKGGGVDREHTYSKRLAPGGRCAGFNGMNCHFTGWDQAGNPTYAKFQECKNSTPPAPAGKRLPDHGPANRPQDRSGGVVVDSPPPGRGQETAPQVAPRRN